MNSEDNLKEAFSGESQARSKYLAFAQKAEAEGYPKAARLFRAAAEAETIHAINHLKTLGMIKTTSENLQAAVAGETYEFEEMYPAFIKDAQAENNKAALRTFNLANEAEKVHAQLYQKALESLEPGKDESYLVCPVCGYIAEGEAPDKCPICGTAKEKFLSVA